MVQTCGWLSQRTFPITLWSLSTNQFWVRLHPCTFLGSCVPYYTLIHCVSTGFWIGCLFLTMGCGGSQWPPHLSRRWCWGSVTTPLVQKMMLRLKGLPGGPLNLTHWVKVKGNASADMCKKPFSMNYTKSHALTTFPLGWHLVRISAMLFPPSCVTTFLYCHSLHCHSNTVTALSNPIPWFAFQCCCGLEHSHPSICLPMLSWLPALPSHLPNLPTWGIWPPSYTSIWVWLIGWSSGLQVILLRYTDLNSLTTSLNPC